MQTISLPISVTSNAALNPDHITLLRSLNLQQGNLYQVNLSFYSGLSPYFPNLGDFAFNIREGGAPINLVSVNTLSGSGFILDLTTPTVATALGSAKSKEFRGLMSFADGSSLDIIEPFGVRIANSFSGVSGVSQYVSSLNGLGGSATVQGSGNIYVAANGQTVTIFGSGLEVSSNYQSFVYQIPSGFDSVTVPFSPPFATTPVVAYALNLPASGSAGIYAMATVNTTPTGFAVAFTAPSPASGYSLSIIARA